MRKLLLVFCLLAVAAEPSPAPAPASAPPPAHAETPAPAPMPAHAETPTPAPAEAPNAAAPPAPELTQAEATGVLGRMVRDSDGKEIGRIVDVLVEPSGQPRAVVVDAGGFLGVGARRVAVAWSTVHVPAPDSANEDVSIDMTDSQIRTAPSYTDRTKPAMIVGPAVPAAPAGAPAAPAAAAPAVAK